MDGGLWENEMGIQTLRPHGLAPRTPRAQNQRGCGLPGEQGLPRGEPLGGAGQSVLLPCPRGPQRPAAGARSRPGG